MYDFLRPNDNRFRWPCVASLGQDGEVVGLEIDGCIEMADAQTGH